MWEINRTPLVDACLLGAGDKLEKGLTALLSCFEDMIRFAAPSPSVLSPRLARAPSASPAGLMTPVQPPLPPNTPGTAVMEDDPPRCTLTLHASS